MKKIYLFIIICCLTIFYNKILAQNGIVVTGINTSASNGQVSYSVGQVNYTTTKTNNGTISTGVQQAFEIFITLGMDENGIKLSSPNVQAYPNPTNNFLTLSIENYKPENISFEVFDMQGKIVLAKTADGKNTSISLSNLTNGTYFIKVIHANTPIKTFKIIKNQ